MEHGASSGDPTPSTRNAGRLPFPPRRHCISGDETLPSAIDLLAMSCLLLFHGHSLVFSGKNQEIL
jgi:hypothetical protein